MLFRLRKTWFDKFFSAYCVRRFVSGCQMLNILHNVFSWIGVGAELNEN